jgi:hypothetical protein
MPSSPILQAWRNTISPSSCSRFVQPQARGSFCQHRGQRRLAHLERLAPQVVAVKLDQVEGIEEHARIVPAVADAIEAGTKFGANNSLRPAYRDGA